MKRNGTTKAGRIRWRCKDSLCGAIFTRSNNTDAAGLKRFLHWLFNPVTQDKVGAGSARTFRRLAERFWVYWPLPHFHEEPVAVLHVDGLHLGRKAVVLIAANEAGKPVGWNLG